MTNDNQRIENVVVVASPGNADLHTAVTKMRFWNEDGTPFALKGAENKTRLDDLEGRLAALEGAANARVEEQAEPQNDEAPAEPQQ